MFEADYEAKKLHPDFGEKDFDLRYSKKTIPVYMPRAEVVIRKGYAHCGYMKDKPDEYVKELEKRRSRMYNLHWLAQTNQLQ